MRVTLTLLTICISSACHAAVETPGEKSCSIAAAKVVAAQPPATVKTVESHEVDKQAAATRLVDSYENIGQAVDALDGRFHVLNGTTNEKIRRMIRSGERLDARHLFRDTLRDQLEAGSDTSVTSTIIGRDQTDRFVCGWDATGAMVIRPWPADF